MYQSSTRWASISPSAHSPARVPPSAPRLPAHPPRPHPGAPYRLHGPARRRRQPTRARPASPRPLSPLGIPQASTYTSRAPPPSPFPLHTKPTRACSRSRAGSRVRRFVATGGCVQTPGPERRPKHAHAHAHSERCNAGPRACRGILEHSIQNTERGIRTQNAEHRRTPRRARVPLASPRLLRAPATPAARPPPPDRALDEDARCGSRLRVRVRQGAQTHWGVALRARRVPAARPLAAHGPGDTRCQKSRRHDTTRHDDVMALQLPASTSSAQPIAPDQRSENIAHRTSNIKHRTPNIERTTHDARRKTENRWRKAESSKAYRTPPLLSSFPPSSLLPFCLLSFFPRSAPYPLPISSSSLHLRTLASHHPAQPARPPASPPACQLHLPGALARTPSPSSSSSSSSSSPPSSSSSSPPSSSSPHHHCHHQPRPVPPVAGAQPLSPPFWPRGPSVRPFAGEIRQTGKGAGTRARAPHPAPLTSVPRTSVPRPRPRTSVPRAPHPAHEREREPELNLA
ncbi:hypothetical protein CERSUDRAFT_100764 [Gelatoporia subvermispora B]|uniref:Uncharacterized protein n=1 Tax=Ceriporiopsis subvermispora (strain B) TaxID=914234 RepID=M2Q2L6_CERS8|nr:hypothetical protein CERSUDRAFT_100764 [Gelatoporia subvermispora B]